MRERWFELPDGLKLYGREHGPPDGSLILGLHGLTRNAEDFDALGRRLPACWRLLALDFRGRGQSDYDAQWQRYEPATYVADIGSVLAADGSESAVFCGTSLGGLVTMLTAARHPERVRAAILNDIGPVIEADGLARIQDYTGKLPVCQDWQDAEAQVRAVYGDGLPNLSAEAWRELAARSYAEDSEGRPLLRFDPNIGRAIRELDMGLGDPWALFCALEPVPTLVLRGALSDILGRETVRQMRRRKPDLTAVEVPDRGHVPLLDEPVAVAAIHALLEGL